MIHPIPSGTRDVLPDEMRELRAIVEGVRGVFEAAGYGEVATPALEYQETLARSELSAANPAFRTVDEQGHTLVLRSDMTVPIARVVATRYPTTEPPLRLCYVAPVYLAARPQRGHPREVLQAGIELVGAPSPQGTAEALSVLCAVLDRVGLSDYRVGLGDASLYPRLLDELGVDEDRRAPLVHELETRDFVGLEREARALGLADDDAELLWRMPQLRGGAEVLEQAAGPAAEAGTGLRSVLDLLEPEQAGRVIFDLGLARPLGYYTGAVFEVYEPNSGMPLGGGGRYDDLIGRFGRSLPAVGFALSIERLHEAVAGQRPG